MRGRRRAPIEKSTPRVAHRRGILHQASKNPGKSSKISSISAHNHKAVAWSLRDAATRPVTRGIEARVGGCGRRAALQVGWQEGTYRPNLARQLEISCPAMAWTVLKKLPPEKVEDTCESGRRRAECSPLAASVERRNAQLGQDLSSSCWDARLNVNLHERVRHGVGCKTCCTGISRVREASM